MLHYSDPKLCVGRAYDLNCTYHLQPNPLSSSPCPQGTPSATTTGYERSEGCYSCLAPGGSARTLLQAEQLLPNFWSLPLSGARWILFNQQLTGPVFLGMCYLKSSPLTDRVKAGKKLQGEINAEHLKINAFHRQNAIYRVLVFIWGWLPAGMTGRKALLKLLPIFTTAVGTTGVWQGCGPVPEPGMTKLPCLQPRAWLRRAGPGAAPAGSPLPCNLFSFFIYLSCSRARGTPEPTPL